MHLPERFFIRFVVVIFIMGCSVIAWMTINHFKNRLNLWVEKVENKNIEWYTMELYDEKNNQTPFRFTEYQGKSIACIFLSSWINNPENTKKEILAMIQHNQPDEIWIGIVKDSQYMDRLIKETIYNSTKVFDATTIYNEVGIPGLPTWFFLNQEHQLKEIKVGNFHHIY